MMKGMNILDVMLIILVIYIPNQLHFPADLGLKGMNVLNILIALTLLAMVATGARNPRPAPIRWRIALLALTLCVAFLVAQFRAPADVLYDLTVLKSVLTGMLMYFIFYHSATDRDRIDRLTATILLVAFVAALEGAREALDYGIGQYSMTHRVSGPFGHTYENANRAGAFYATFLPLFLALMLFSRTNKRMALAGLIGTGCTIFAIFATYSRQAYFIAALAAAVLSIRRNIAVGALALFALAGWTYWAPAAAVERVEMTYVEGEGGEEQLEVSARSRLQIWSGAGRMIMEHPFGIGLNRFQGEIGSYAEVSNLDAHNSYVLVAAEGGLHSLLVLLFVLAGFVTLAVRVVRGAEGTTRRSLGYGFAGCVFCMMLSNVYGSPFFSNEVMGNFWALSGLMAGRLSLERKGIDPVRTTRRRPPRTSA